MRTLLMGLLVAGCAAMGAQAAPLGPKGVPVPVLPVPVLEPAPQVQPVQYYEDWRRREWRRREAYERWRRHEARREWRQEQRFRQAPPYGPGPRHGSYGGPRW